jgi:hypothetical protein
VPAQNRPPSTGSGSLCISNFGRACAFVRKVNPESVIEIEVELDGEGHVRARVIAAAQVASTAKLRFTSEPPCREGGG